MNAYEILIDSIPDYTIVDDDYDDTQYFDEAQKASDYVDNFPNFASYIMLCEYKDEILDSSPGDVAAAFAEKINRFIDYDFSKLADARSIFIVGMKIHKHLIKNLNELIEKNPYLLKESYLDELYSDIYFYIGELPSMYVNDYNKKVELVEILKSNGYMGRFVADDFKSE